MDLNKFFDMAGYDTLAQVQDVTDDYVRYFVLHNNSTHVLLAEAHAAVEPDDNGMQERGKLVAVFPYGPGDHGWRAAYKAALVEAQRLALAGVAEMCDGCGCLPGDGVTAGCTDADGCGYFSEVAGRTVPLGPADVDAAAEHDIDARMAELHDIANHVEPRD